MPREDDGELVSLLADLRKLGYGYDSVSDLRLSGKRYRSAIPALLDWLPLVHDPRLKESIVRALSVPWARPSAQRPLLNEFRSVGDDDPGLRWAIGNALEVIGDDAIFDDLSELVADRSFGRARQMIALALGKSKRPEAIGVLLSVADDPDIDGHVVVALSKLNAREAVPLFISRSSDSRAWVRRAASRAVARLGERPDAESSESQI